MALQYKRSVQLLIGTATDGLRVENLRVMFTVTKDLVGYPNLAEISVYNLSKASRAKIENEFETVVLNAGYDGSVQTLFVGDIRNAASRKEGPDWITTIFAGDGNKDFAEAYSNTAFAEGTSVASMVNEVVKDFVNVSKNVLSEIGLTDKTVGSTVISSDTSTALDTLGNQYNFDWSIQDGTFQIVPRDAFVSQAIKLSKSSGLIGAPVITEIGVELNSLLAPAAAPGRLVEIVSGTATLSLGNLFFREVTVTNATGFYKILKLIHSGDTHGNAWTTQYTCTRINALKAITGI